MNQGLPHLAECDSEATRGVERMQPRLRQDDLEFRGEVLRSRQIAILNKIFESFRQSIEICESVRRYRMTLIRNRTYTENFSQFSVKLRDHPLMCYQGKRNWPPPDGILEHAIMHDQFANECFLVIESNKTRFVSPLIFDDAVFGEQICRLLQHYSGFSIKEIGDLDLICAL
jgi:hypothetical protein